MTYNNLTKSQLIEQIKEIKYKLNQYKDMNKQTVLDEIKYREEFYNTKIEEITQLYEEYLREVQLGMSY